VSLYCNVDRELFSVRLYHTVDCGWLYEAVPYCGQWLVLCKIIPYCGQWVVLWETRHYCGNWWFFVSLYRFVDFGWFCQAVPYCGQ